jgi:uncharacterized protein (TIGR03435 family)
MAAFCGARDLLAKWIVIAIGATIGLAHAQTRRPEFEAASIKPSAGTERGVGIHPLPGGRLNVENAPLRVLISVAYNVRTFQIAGGPSWTYSAPFDIAAKGDDRAPFPQELLMLQTLLESRFKLAVHRETREAPVYELTIAKSGLKLAPSKEGACVVVEPNSAPPPPRPGATPPNYCGNFGLERGRIDAFGARMQPLSNALATVLDRTVIDKTGLTGMFDIHLAFTPDLATATDPATSSDLGPSVFTALQEQLGLKLESAKGPVSMLVIDRVEKPSAN